MLPFIRGECAPPSDFNERLNKATETIFAKQLAAGLAFVNDGELGRRDYVTAARNRMSGFDAHKAAVGAGDLEEMTEYSDKFEGRKGVLIFAPNGAARVHSCGTALSVYHPLHRSADAHQEDRGPEPGMRRPDHLHRQRRGGLADGD